MSKEPLCVEWFDGWFNSSELAQSCAQKRRGKGAKSGITDIADGRMGKYSLWRGSPSESISVISLSPKTPVLAHTIYVHLRAWHGSIQCMPLWWPLGSCAVDVPPSACRQKVCIAVPSYIRCCSTQVKVIYWPSSHQSGKLLIHAYRWCLVTAFLIRWNTHLQQQSIEATSPVLNSIHLSDKSAWSKRGVLTRSGIKTWSTFWMFWRGKGKVMTH